MRYQLSDKIILGGFLTLGVFATGAFIAMCLGGPWQ
jgi:hypothetical protein